MLVPILPANVTFPLILTVPLAAPVLLVILLVIVPVLRVTAEDALPRLILVAVTLVPNVIVWPSVMLIAPSFDVPPIIPLKEWFAPEIFNVPQLAVVPVKLLNVFVNVTAPLALMVRAVPAAPPVVLPRVVAPRRLYVLAATMPPIVCDPVNVSVALSLRINFIAPDPCPMDPNVAPEGVMVIGVDAVGVKLFRSTPATVTAESIVIADVVLANRIESVVTKELPPAHEAVEVLDVVLAPFVEITDALALLTAHVAIAIAEAVVKKSPQHFFLLVITWFKFIIGFHLSN